MSFESILIVHLSSCAFMTGLIWVIQLVHYPSFHFVEKKDFVAFEAFHSQRITWIVLPVMSLELFTAVGLFWMSLQTPNFGLTALTLGSVGALWVYTLMVSAPLHGRLLREDYSKKIVETLVNTNWVRTLLWTARLVVVSYWVATGF